MAISRSLTDDELITRFLEPDPNTGDPAEWQLRDSGAPVWALVAVLAKDLSNAEQVAHDYQISSNALDAVWTYYRRHESIIDARILSNRIG